VDVAITPKKAGPLRVEGFAELQGLASKYVRSAPIFTDASQVEQEHKTYIHIKSNLPIGSI
jgi:hypothetical protein